MTRDVVADASELILERPHEHVALLRLNRPQQRNALSTGLRNLIARQITALAADDSVRCIVITGDEKSFASGGDLAEMAQRSVTDVAYNSTKEPWRVMRACEKPIVAAIRGFALGGGCELAMHCDIMVAGRKAKLGQPEINIGISPGSGGVQRVARAMGKFRAMRWLLTGEIMSGEKAYELGLVSEVVDDDKVLDRALAFARAIASLSALGEAGSKEAILAGADGSLDAGLLLENRAFQLLFSSEDRKEGMSAFLERRTPNFKGR